MKIREIQYSGHLDNDEQEWLPENTIQIEKNSLMQAVENICRSEQCRYPLLALRLLLHVITSVDETGRIYVSARQLSRSLDVHYDTVTKCLKYLRDSDVLCFDKE